MPWDGPFLANPEYVAAQVMREALLPPPPVDLNAWAVDNVRFGPESPFPGPYNPERFPFFRRILEVLGPDHPARIVVLRKSAQLGGTVLAQIFMGGCLDLDPGPFLYVHPTEGNAIRFARTKWRPMLKATPALASIFSSAGHKEGGNSTLFQERRDGRGFLQFSGANSEASLSMISMPRQVQDDLAKWEVNSAGDPEGQADSRSKAFELAKLFKTSTPLVADNCRITRAFKAGTQEFYHVPCPHCGDLHPLDWEDFKASIETFGPEFAHFTCPECGGVIEEHHRPAMNLAGEWVAHNPGASMISFHLWSAYSPLQSFRRLAESWLNAKGDAAREQTFLNDEIGLAYEVQGESPPWEGLRDRGEENGRSRGVIPRGALKLTLSFDCQSDRVEGVLIGWGRNLRRWVIETFVVEGHISEPAAREQLDALVKREWPDSFGGKRKVDLVGIDGNAWTNEVFDWVRPKPQSLVLMLRGIKGDNAQPLAPVGERGRDGKIRKYAKRFFNVGACGIKNSLYKYLRVEDPLQRGYVDFPAGLGDEYYRQLTSERRQLVPRKDGRGDGFPIYRWCLPAGLRNEMLDVMVYGEALATRLGWRHMAEAQWDALEARLEVPKHPGQLDLEDLLVQPPPVPASRSEAPGAVAGASKAPGAAARKSFSKRLA